MMAPRRLPLRAEPYPDESFTGFVLRLALRNGMPNANELARQAGIAPLPLLFPDDAQFAIIATMAGLPGPQRLRDMALARGPSDGQSRAIIFRGQEMPRSWLTSGRRACPECLADESYHRVAWDFAPIHACPDHAVFLVETCPSCDRPLDWSASDLTRCRCGFDLRRAKAPPARRACAAPAAWVRGALLRDGSGHAPPPLATLRARAAIESVALAGLLLGDTREDEDVALGRVSAERQATGYAAFDAPAGELADRLSLALDVIPRQENPRLPTAARLYDRLASTFAPGLDDVRTVLRTALERAGRRVGGKAPMAGQGALDFR